MENLTTQLDRPLHIYFGDHLLEKSQEECTANEIIALLDCKIKWCTSFIELSNSVFEKPKNIVIHIDTVCRNGGTIAEFMLMIETLIKFANISRPNIGIVIEKDTPITTIKELQKHKILGIVPSVQSFEKNECITAINSLLEDQAYWPKHIINKLPGHKKSTTKSNIHLTDRQTQGYDLIASRGLSNKQIARTLNISESTVKIHVSAIMKALCVRNRTQLALTK
jgi:DNA-binding NarL/FixJ family response regulator